MDHCTTVLYIIHCYSSNVRSFWYHKGYFKETCAHKTLFYALVEVFFTFWRDMLKQKSKTFQFTIVCFTFIFTLQCCESNKLDNISYNQFSQKVYKISQLIVKSKAVVEIQFTCDKFELLISISDNKQRAQHRWYDDFAVRCNFMCFSIILLINNCFIHINKLL